MVTKKSALLTGLALLLSASAFFARADVTFNLDTLINGTPPVGSTPWLTATFEDIAAGQVKLTLTNNMPAGEFIDTVVFNSILNPTSFLFVATQPPFVNSVTRHSSQDLTGGSNMKAGLFNIEFQFQIPASPNPGRFDGGMTSVWDITGTGLTSSSFLLQSIDDGQMVGGPYYMAAHVQGIPDITGTLSGSIGAVPEPETYAMMLAGLGLMGFVARRRRRQGAAA